MNRSKWALLGGDERCGRPGRQNPKSGKIGPKMDILNLKNIDFMFSTDFKLMG